MPRHLLLKDHLRHLIHRFQPMEFTQLVNGRKRKSWKNHLETRAVLLQDLHRSINSNQHIPWLEAEKTYKTTINHRLNSCKPLASCSKNKIQTTPKSICFFDPPDTTHNNIVLWTGCPSYTLRLSLSCPNMLQDVGRKELLHSSIDHLKYVPPGGPTRGTHVARNPAIPSHPQLCFLGSPTIRKSTCISHGRSFNACQKSPALIRVGRCRMLVQSLRHAMTGHHESDQPRAQPGAWKREAKTWSAYSSTSSCLGATPMPPPSAPSSQSLKQPSKLGLRTMASHGIPGFCCIAEVLLHPAIPNKARAARDTRPVMTPLMQMQDHAETKNEYGRRHKIMTNIIWWWECAKIWYTPTPPVYHLFPNETCRPHFQTRPYVNSGLL